MVAVLTFTVIVLYSLFLFEQNQSKQGEEE